MSSLSNYLIVSAILFMIGAGGVIFRKNVIVIFMCIELMLNAVNLTLIAFSQFMGDQSGQILVFFVMTVAAAEAAVGLAIVISVYRNKETIEIDKLNLLKEVAIIRIVLPICVKQSNRKIQLLLTLLVKFRARSEHCQRNSVQNRHELLIVKISLTNVY